MRSAVRRRSVAACILNELLLRDGRAGGRVRLRLEPARARARNHGADAGRLGLDPIRYRTDARLMEMSFGRWEGFTFADLQTREADALAARERDKWGFVLPGGESYAQLEVRVQAWYESVERATVVSAHGGVCRALIAHLGMAQPEAASMGDIQQGVVYVFENGRMARHA